MKDKKKKNVNGNVEEFDLDDIVQALNDNVIEDISSFEDVINLQGAVGREVYIGDIVPGLGSTVDGYIRFWNEYDDKHNIPVSERKPIKIYIDSNGGSLTDSFTIIDAIRMSETPILTICTGTAYSGGFFIFIAGHMRVAYPHSSFLYHEGSTGNAADAGKFRNFADFYVKQLDQLKDITLKYTKMTEEYYKEHQRDDLWLTAEEALELGVCDKISTGLV